MKLKKIPRNTVVHTPTEAEAKELLAILHENGYEWGFCSESLINLSHWDKYETAMGYFINANDKIIQYGDMDDRDNLDGYYILTLADFKERYCEEESQPEFEVGDWVIHNHKNRELGQIVAYYPDEKFCYATRFGKEYHNMAEHQLLPYTAPETKDEAMETKDEAKELNLCELLKGHAGEKFYSPMFGERVLIEIGDRDYPISFGEEEFYDFGIDGCWSDGGMPLLYPSRALYEQYPLDPQKAWMKWQEEQEYEISVSTRQKKNDYYYNVSRASFRTPADRDKCIEEIKAIIEKYSKK